MQREESAMTSQFKGSGLLFLRNVFLYVLAAGPLVSACLMGSAWPRLYLSLIVLSLIALPPAAAVVDRVDGFTFDDERRTIVKPMGKGIPYARMQRLDVRETSGLLRVTVRLDGLMSRSLASALPGRDKARLLEEFAKRAPGAVIRQRRHADWKSLLLISLLIFVAAAGAHMYLYASRPLLRTLPEQLLGAKPETKNGTKNDAARQKTRSYSIGEFDILLPKRFLPGKAEATQAEFVDNAGRTLVRADTESGKAGRKRNLFALTTGMENHVSMLELAYRARFGIIPLLLKGIALEGMSDVRIFEARSNGLAGYVTQGKRDGNEITLILLTEAPGGTTLLLSLLGQERWDAAAVRNLLSGIRLRQN